MDPRFPVRAIILTFLLFAIFSMTSLVLFPAPSGGSESIFPLLLVCLLNVVVLSLLVVNSRVGGDKTSSSGIFNILWYIYIAKSDRDVGLPQLL